MTWYQITMQLKRITNEDLWTAVRLNPDQLADNYCVERRLSCVTRDTRPFNLDFYCVADLWL